MYNSKIKLKSADPKAFICIMKRFHHKYINVTNLQMMDYTIIIIIVVIINHHSSSLTKTIHRGKGVTQSYNSHSIN